MGWKKWILIVGGILGVYIVMNYMLPLILPFLVGWLLAGRVLLTAEKIEKRLSVKKIKKEWIGILLISFLFLLVGGIFFWLGKEILKQLKSVVSDSALMDFYVTKMIKGCCESLEKFLGISQKDTMGFFEYYQEILKKEVAKALPEKVMGFTFEMIKKTGLFLSGLVVCYFSSLLFLKEQNKFKKWIAQNSLATKFYEAGKNMKSAGGGYLKAQALIMLVVGGICCVGFLLLKNPYFLIIGIVLGLLDALPLIGTGTILVPLALWNLLQGTYFTAVAYVLIYIICDLARQFMEPKLIGDKIGVSPLLVLVSVYVGVFVFGVPGVILGPVSVIIIRELYNIFTI